MDLDTCSYSTIGFATIPVWNAALPYFTPARFTYVIEGTYTLEGAAGDAIAFANKLGWKLQRRRETAAPRITWSCGDAVTFCRVRGLETPILSSREVMSDPMAGLSEAEDLHLDSVDADIRRTYVRGHTVATSQSPMISFVSQHGPIADHHDPRPGPLAHVLCGRGPTLDLSTHRARRT